MRPLLVCLAVLAPASAHAGRWDHDARAALALAAASRPVPPAPAPSAPTARACVCSPACTCGCQDGGPCTCEVTTLSPRVTALSPAPAGLQSTFYPAAPVFSAPVHGANRGFSFAPSPAFRPALSLPFGGGMRCGPGG